MIYFINCYQRVDDDGVYHTYRLYAGESEEKLKMQLINDLVSEWEWPNVKDFLDTIDHSKDFLAIIDDLRYHIEDSSNFRDYDLSVTHPYTNTTNAFDFYNSYISEAETVKFYIDDYSFYFYGDYFDNNRDIFPSLAEVHRSKGVHISASAISRISNRLK